MTRVGVWRFISKFGLTCGNGSRFPSNINAGCDYLRSKCYYFRLKCYYVRFFEISCDSSKFQAKKNHVLFVKISYANNSYPHC